VTPNNEKETLIGLAERLAGGLAKGLAKGLPEGLAKGLVKGLAEGQAKGLARQICVVLVTVMVVLPHRLSSRTRLLLWCCVLVSRRQALPRCALTTFAAGGGERIRLS
jgi:hypothetical protein